MFGRKKDSNVATPDAPISFKKVEAPASGKLNLRKGESVSLAKGGAIVASNGWTADNKDYDLKALIRYKDGHQVYIGMDGSDEVQRTPEGAVVHGGDVTAPGEREKVTITWHDSIASVALSSYSAIKNGRGSFNEYGVFVEIANGSQVIGIPADDTSANRSSYTLCFGEIVFNPDGTFTVNNLELYSSPSSERRIAYKGDRVVMDAGPEGRSKP